MGNTYTNYTLHGPSQQEVVNALAGRSAIVTPAAQGCVVVFDEQSDELLQAAVPALALQWSDALACPVLGIMNYRNDILWYRLYIQGKKVDEYASWIGVAGHPRIPRGGDATKLCNAFGSSNVSEVESVLRKPSEGDDSYRFAIDRHAELARALGIPSFGVGAGYSRIAHGQLPDGLPWDNLVKVTSSAVSGDHADITIKDGPEALEWLRHNGHEAALASNRFSSTAEAIAFVEQLYAAGAQRVFVPADTIVDDEEEQELGGNYSDSLAIELSSSDVPEALTRLYCEEATLEGHDLRHEPPPVINGRYLFLWWD